MQFQFTYLYKVRLRRMITIVDIICFNSRTYIRYDISIFCCTISDTCFNSRTYIRYDLIGFSSWQMIRLFQFTYLYKVRRNISPHHFICFKFQFTYLYKVRHMIMIMTIMITSFNSRTYIRYDLLWPMCGGTSRFQFTYLYKVRLITLYRGGRIL